MIHRLVVPGETPSKKNSRINTRSGRSFPSRKFSLWHGEAVSVIKRQWAKKPLERGVWLILSFYHKDSRRRDSDNQVSSILDTLVDAGVLQDDSWTIVRRISVANMLDPERKGRCEINIVEAAGDC